MSKIRLSWLLTILVAITAVLALAPVPKTSAAELTGQMMNRNTRLCMTSSGSTTPGTPIVQWPCNGSPNQQWTAVTQALGGYILVNEGSSSSGHQWWCLNERGGVAYKYNQLVMWPCNGTPPYNDRFYGSTDQNGGFKMALETRDLMPNGYCVTSGGNKQWGSTVYEWPCNRRSNQYWTQPGVDNPYGYDGRGT
jgi:hypothetical protein